MARLDECAATAQNDAEKPQETKRRFIVIVRAHDGGYMVDNTSG